MEIREKQRSYSWTSFNEDEDCIVQVDTNSSIENVYKKNRSTLQIYSNKNNNKIYCGDNISLINSLEDDLKIDNKVKDHFNMYMKLINQLRLNRYQRLRSVSCQSEKKYLSKAETFKRPNELMFDFKELYNQIANKDRKEQISLNDLKMYDHLKPLKTLEDFCFYISTIKNFINDERDIDMSAKIINHEMLKYLEWILKSIKEKFNINSIKNDPDVNCQNDIMKNKRSHKSLSKSIQVKVRTHSKAVNNGKTEMINYKTNVSIEVILNTICVEIFTCIYQLLSEFFQNINFLDLKFLTSSLFRAENFEAFNDLYSFEKVQLILHKKHKYSSLNSLDSKTDNYNLSDFKSNDKCVSINIDINGNLDSNTLPLQLKNLSDCATNTYSNRYYHDISSKKRPRPRFKSLAARKSFNVLFKQNQKTLQSRSSSDTSLLKSISTLDMIENDLYKYRSNCASIAMSEMKYLTITELQPIIQNDTCKVRSQMIKEVQKPKIKIQYCQQNLDLSESVSVNNDSYLSSHSFNKDDKIFNENQYTYEESLGHSFGDSLVDFNQSQSDSDSNRNFLASHINCYQSQCSSRSCFEFRDNIKQSAKIILNNPFSNYSKLKVLQKCHSMIEEKCIPLSSRLKSIDVLLEKIYSNSQTSIQATESSENILNIKNKYNNNNTSIHVEDEIAQKYKQVDSVKHGMDFIQPESLQIDIMKSLTEEKLEKKKSLFGSLLKNSTLLDSLTLKNSFTKKVKDYCHSESENTESKSLQLTSDKDPFPNRCGIKSLYQTIFQSWIFQ